MKKLNRNQIIILIAILLFAFLLRLIPIRTSHWWDETVYLQHAEIMFSGRTNYNEFHFRPPLLSILFFLVFQIKHSIFSASILTASLGTLASLFGFLIGRKLYGIRTGIIAGLILAFSPFLIINSNYLLTDMPVVTFMGISFYLALFKEKKLFLFLSGAFFSLAVLMKFTAALLAIIFLPYFLIKKYRIKQILLFALGSAIIIFPYFIGCQIKFGNFLTPFTTGRGLVDDKNEHTYFYLFNTIKVFTILIPIGLVLWLGNLLISIKNKKNIKIKNSLILALWVIVFFYYLTKVPHKELRYILPLTLPLVLLASHGISLCFRHVNSKWKFAFWVLFILYISFLAFPRVIYIKETGLIDKLISDEQIIADYLLHGENYSGIVYTNMKYPVFAYYTGLETRQVWPYDERFYDEINSIMEDPGVFISAINSYIHKPAMHPASSWMDNDPRFKHLKTIGNFFIYEYEPDK